MTDDAEMLREFVEKKSETAFAGLVRKHIDLVYSVALRQVGGDVHLARDVAQVVFTSLAQKAPLLVRRTVLGGWLYRTTQFIAIDVVRTESRRRLREKEANLMPEISAPGGPDVTDFESARPLLDQAIAELAETDRDAIVLRYFEGVSFAEIGGRQRLTESGARMRVERALDKLHAILARRGVTSTSATVAGALAAQVSTAAPAGLAASVASSALAGGAPWGVATTLLAFMTSSKFIVGMAGIAAVTATVAVYRGQAAQSSVVESTTAVERTAVLSDSGRQKVTIQAGGLDAVARAVGSSPQGNPSGATKRGAAPANGPTLATAGSRLDRLTQLVGLTAAQRAQIAPVLQVEYDALIAISSDERPEKGADARVASREQVRALLTPEQQKIYDRAPQFRGGGLTLIAPETKLERLDTLVRLTPGQKEVATKVFEEELESLLAIPPADRGAKGVEARQAAMAQVRSMLNPQQQEIYDATPQSAGGGKMSSR